MRLQTLIVSVIIKSCWTQAPIVTTPSGDVKGSILTSRLGRDIYSFRGIRYAKAPVRELRFKPPEPVDEWYDVYDATEDGPLCPQPAQYGYSCEDCLNLNIYTTKLPEGGEYYKRPVLIYFDSWGFNRYGGSSEWLGPQYLMDVDIVLVTFNFRLATLGFISTGDDLARGNNGLRDQLEMLRWVKKHIESFGGDPDNICLYGTGVGAWSVILQIVSPMTQGQDLFHKALIVSTPINLHRLPKHQLDIAKKQARLVGCPDDTSENIINCLKTKSAKDLAETLPEFKEFGDNPLLIWYPVIDGEFLTDDPVRLIMKKEFQSIPLVFGQMKDETSYLAYPIINNETLRKEFNDNFERVAPITLLYERDTERSKNISKDIRQFYFKKNDIDKSQLNQLKNLLNDASIGFGVNRYSKLFAQYSSESVHRYLYSFQGRYSNCYIPGTRKPCGVVHNDNLIYQFFMPARGFPYFGQDSPQPEVNALEKGISLLYNFVATGILIPEGNDGGVTWDPFTVETQKYLDFGKKLVLKERLREERYDFWEKHFPLEVYE